MYRGITILFIISPLLLLLLTTAVKSDNILKCYICSSMGEEECGNWLNTSTPLPLPQPVECIPEKIRSLTKIKDQHAIIGKYMKYLDIANDQTHYHSGNMVCTKMIFRPKDNANKNDANKDVVIRSCGYNNTEFAKCEELKQKLFGEIQHCSLCLKEACNGITALSFEIFNLYLAFFIFFILLAYYR